MGIWETFCPICGLPVGYDNSHKTTPKDLKWLNDITIVTSKNQTVRLLDIYGKGSEYDLGGTIIYKSICYILSTYLWVRNNHRVSKEDMFKATGQLIVVDGKELINFITPKEEDIIEYIESYAIHTNCYSLISSSLKYKLKFCDVMKVVSEEFGTLNTKLYGKEYTTYANRQFFDYERIREKANTQDMFITQNPLTNTANKTRIINIWTKLVNRLKAQKCRPSPSMSASLYDVGTVKYGNDGKLWIIKNNANRKVWMVLNKNNVDVYLGRIAKLDSLRNRAKGKKRPSKKKPSKKTRK